MAGLERLVAEQGALIEVLQARVVQLEAELSKHSGNSSMPPSKDANEQRQEAKQSRAERRAAGRKAGKQPGAPGAHLSRRVPDEVREHRPSACGRCGHDLAHGEVVGSVTRQVLDVPEVNVNTVEHVAVKVRCDCGHHTTATFPVEATAAVCWGPNVRALAVYLSVRQHLPVARAAEVMSELLGAPVSAGFIVAAQADAGRRLAGFIAHIKVALTRAKVLHADETSTRVSADTWWMHVAATTLITLLVAHRRRGREAISEIDVLTAFRGVLVRDGLAVYENLTDASHAQCGAHLLRHLAAVGEADVYKQWTKEMTKILLDAKKASESAAVSGRGRVHWRSARTLRDRYRVVLDDAFKLLPQGPPPRGKHRYQWRESQRKAWNLATRLRAHEHEVLRLLDNTAVPFTNNQAERDLRMTKLHDKISGTFRSDDHASHFATIRSYIQTGLKHNLQPATLLRQLFTTGAWLPTT